MAIEQALNLQSQIDGKNCQERTPQGKERQANDKGDKREP
jgi:hypothetical protein